MQGIVTTYHGATNTRGARISARAIVGRVSVSYDHALNQLDNHKAALEALARKMEWLPSQGGAYAAPWIVCEIPQLPNSMVWALASTFADRHEIEEA